MSHERALSRRGPGTVAARTPRRRAGAVLTLLLLVLAPLAGAGPAAAHTDLVSTAPVADGLVSITTPKVVLVFADDVAADGSRIVVRDPDGTDVTRGETSTMARVVEVGLDLRHPGKHLVIYRVVGGDGHVISGTWSFRVAATGGAAPATGSTLQVDAGQDLSAATDAPPAAATLATWLWWLLGGLCAAGVVWLVTSASPEQPRRGRAQVARHRGDPHAATRTGVRPESRAGTAHKP